MDTTFVRKLILLWLLMELLLSWTVVYKETEILVLGHFAMLIGSLWAFAKANRQSTPLGLNLSGGPPRPQDKIRTLRRRRHLDRQTKAA